MKYIVVSGVGKRDTVVSSIFGDKSKSSRNDFIEKGIKEQNLKKTGRWSVDEP